MKRIAMNPEAFSALLNTEAEQLAQFSIGFVTPHTENDIITGRLSGSGTLVSIEGKEGVLTAEHVVRYLRKQRAVAIIFTAYPRRVEPQLVFDPRLCRDFSYAPQIDAARGPDLSFLVLPPDTIATLKATKTFYNLSKRCPTMLEHPPLPEIGFWAINGIGDEWTTDAPSQIVPQLIKHFTGRLLGPLERINRRTAGDFDYIVFEMIYNDSYGGPQSFQGYSGGGVWQLITKLIEGEPTITERHLMGVAFHESEIREHEAERIREVTCHGRESVYRMLVDRVREGLAN